MYVCVRGRCVCSAAVCRFVLGVCVLVFAYVGMCWWVFVYVFVVAVVGVCVCISRWCGCLCMNSPCVYVLSVVYERHTSGCFVCRLSRQRVGLCSLCERTCVFTNVCVCVFSLLVCVLSSGGGIGGRGERRMTNRTFEVKCLPPRLIMFCMAVC